MNCPVPHRQGKKEGQIAVGLLFLSAVVVILISGFVTLASSFMLTSVRALNRAQAFAVAEAGIEYYRWHLAHANQDFEDGTGQPGPYVHTYYDKDGVSIGMFTLEITPPPAGSTIVTVESTGKIFADPSIQKIIKVRMGIPSFAKYAWALNSNVNFGSTAQVYGPIHSNAGIHFDGVAYNLVTSALTSYDDPDHSGANEYAVHTHSGTTDPVPPTPLPPRPDVFVAGRSTGVPAIDFQKLTQDLATIKSLSIASGTYFASSTALGWELTLATSGIYAVDRVVALVAPGGSCTNPGQAGWGTWSVQTKTFYATGTIPSNGNLFFEDHLWVKGQISGKRLTVAAGRFPYVASTSANIIVNSSTLYTNYDGTDALALIAQNNLNVGLRSENTLRIDGALVAENGRIGRHSYNSSSCGSTRTRTKLVTYGMLGTALRPAFYYSSLNGYQSREYHYDSNLLYAPPPNFPLTADQYTLISWDEVQ